MASVPTASAFLGPITETPAQSQKKRVMLYGSSGGASLPVPVGSALAGGVVGTAYTETVGCQGGTSPYSFSVTSGALPIGLTLNSATGVISGTPAAAGTSTFTVTVTDSTGATGSQQFTITVAPSGGGSSGSTAGENWGWFS